MRKTFRKKKLTMVFTRKPNGNVLPERGGAGADVQCYVEYLASKDSYEFSLCGIAFLKVKST